jgi:predicted nucleic acid-binding protein
MRAILDTSVLLAPDVPRIDADLSISVASLAELHFGVLVARDSQRRAERLRRLTLLERRFSALPIDDAVARSYGQLAAAVTAFGRQPRARVMDLLIAATARTHEAVLYTWNPGDLDGLDELVDIRTPSPDR